VEAPGVSGNDWQAYRLIDLCGLCVAKSSAGFTESDQLAARFGLANVGSAVQSVGGQGAPGAVSGYGSCHGTERAERSVGVK